MILRALAHVSEERIANALNVAVATIKEKRDLLKGICPEAADILRNERVSAGAFCALRKMKPVRQIDVARLMVSAKKFSGRFARALLNGTREELLVSTPATHPRDTTAAQQSMMEQETDELLRHVDSIKANYGNDILDLTAACRYVQRLLANTRVHRYCGILSLGQAVFFSLGGYAMGMYLMRQIGARGVYGDPILPDFMVFLNWKSLPWFWYGFNHFGIALAAMILAPALLALVFGWFAFRSRVTGVYFSIITQALTYAMMLAFFRNDMGFGGNNGFTDFKEILGFDLVSVSTRVVLLVVTCMTLLASYLVCRAITRSPAGLVMRAISEDESRPRFLACRVESFKLGAFVVSAVIAGLAGALYVPQAGIINPSEFAPINSIEAVIWVAVGGRGTLYGAVAGAVIVNYAKTYLTGAFPEVWLFALGGLFVLVTRLMPRGVMALFSWRKEAK